MAVVDRSGGGGEELQLVACASGPSAFGIN
jgi:hypothetical protein